MFVCFEEISESSIWCRDSRQNQISSTWWCVLDCVYKYLSDNTCTITCYVNWQPPNEFGTNSYRLLVVGQPAHFFSVELTTCLVHLESEQVGAQTGNKSSEPHHTRRYGCVLSLIRQWGLMRESWLRNFLSQSALHPMLHLRLRQDPESCPKRVGCFGSSTRFRWERW